MIAPGLLSGRWTCWLGLRLTRPSCVRQVADSCRWQLLLYYGISIKQETVAGLDDTADERWEVEGWVELINEGTGLRRECRIGWNPIELRHDHLRWAVSISEQQLPYTPWQPSCMQEERFLTSALTNRYFLVTMSVSFKNNPCTFKEEISLQLKEE